MSSGSWLDSVFAKARQDFLAGLKDSSRDYFTKHGTIDAVWDEMDAIQKQQSKTKSLVALKRIEPFLAGLQDYFSVIDTFVQIEPKTACLVWGPLKLIIQLASSLATAFRKLVDLLEEIGKMLPHFKRYAETGMFDMNDQVKNVMGGFYKDILDLNLAMLNFFRNKSLRMVLEPLWPQFRNKIAVIQGNIENHKSLMTSNVTLEHVLRAEEFRRRALSNYEEEIQFRNDTRFKELSNMMASPSCKSKLQSSIDATSPGSGEWLFKDPTFQQWLNAGGSPQRLLWIQGIPGAGKTVLAATAIHRLQSQGHLVLYAFLSHNFQSLGDGARLLHSLTFQAVQTNRDLVPEVHSASISRGQEFTSNTNSAKDLLCDVLTNSSPSFVILDGLDEIEHQKRGNLLKTLLEVLNTCENMKLLVSSRAERDIMRFLEGKGCSVRVDENNSKDIEQHVEQEGTSWAAELQELGADDSDLAVIKAGLNEVVARAKGMFLYVTLVLGFARLQSDLESIRAEMEHLPDGLDQAYGRILCRIRNNKSARRALLWIACAKRPLAESEILQAILIKPSMSDFPKQRKAWVDVRGLCGPIIEVREGVVQFVHFTAREYLFENQSGSVLDMQDAHREILSICLTYLSFSSFDRVCGSTTNDADVLELQSRVLSGDFVLFRYAADFWLDHAKSLHHEQQVQDDMVERICQIIRHFYENRRRVTREQSQIEKSMGFMEDFLLFERTPQLQQSLSVSARHVNRLRYGHTSPEGEISEDPTTLSLGTRRFQTTLEDMVSECQDSRDSTHPATCFCQRSPQLYGTCIFKCKWSFCNFYLNGFSDSTSRDEHEKTHQRPFRCPETGCPYSSLGYEYESDLIQHTFAIHGNGGLGQLESSADIQQLPTATLFAVLELAIMGNDVQSTRNLLLVALVREEGVDMNFLFQLAAWKGSTSMIDLLVSRVQSAQVRDIPLAKKIQNALVVAIGLDNEATVRALLNHGADVNADGHVDLTLQKRTLVYRVLNTAARRMLVIRPVQHALFHMNDRMLALLVDEFGAKVQPEDFSAAIVGTTKDQTGFLENLPKLERFIPVPQSYSNGIGVAVQYHHHVALEVCLKNGGDLTSKLEGSGRSIPLLSSAVRAFQPLPSKARIVVSLLKAGANPYPEGREISWRLRMGMSEIEAYFGLTWDEVVRKTKAGETVLPIDSGGKQDKVSAKADSILNMTSRT